MDPDHELADCPNCDARFQMERDAEVISCPECGYRCAVKRGEGTRIFESTSGADCSLTALFVAGLLLALVVTLSNAGWTRLRP